MKLKPIFTEKTEKETKSGKYTFGVAKNTRKNQIKDYLQKTFGVHVKKVNTISGKNKKVVVKLADKEKLEIFTIKEKK